MHRGSKRNLNKPYRVCEKDDDTDDEDDEVTETHSVQMFENNIYFYGDVDWQSIMKLNMMIKKMNTTTVARVAKNINLFIQSEGGDLMAGLSSMDHIAKSQIPITTIVDGFAASAGAVMVLGGTVRQMMPP